MSEIQDTEYSTAWKEDANEGLPEEGRPSAADPPGQDDLGGEGADAAKPAAADEPTTDAGKPPAGGQENSDEFAGLPEAYVTRLREAEKRAEVAQNTLRSHEGRFSRAERELNELRAWRVAQAKAEPDAKQPEGPILDDEAKAKLAEYDDLGPPIVAAFEAMTAQIEALKGESSKQAERELKQAEQSRNEYLDRQQAVLHERHKPEEVQEIVASQSYADWFVAQPNWVKDLVARNAKELVDGEAAAFVFDKFRADTKPPADPNEQRRQDQLAGSVDVPAKAPAFQPSDPGPSADYKSEWKRAAEEEKREEARNR